MSQRSKVTHSRNQWQHQATQRGARARYQRTQIARIGAERDRVTTARTEAQARLQQLAAPRHRLAAQRHRPVTRPKVDVVLVALQRFVVARSGFRAVSRVRSWHAWALGIKQAPGPQTIINWVIRLAMVRLAAARGLQGLPLRQAPVTHGLIGLLALSIGLGTGKLVAVWACDAQHHQLAPGALALEHIHGIGVSVADAWTGATLADVLERLIAQMGRPAAYRKDGGSELHKAADWLGDKGLSSPCLDDISHAVAGMRTRVDQDHPAFTTFLSACGRVSGTLQHTILACVAPPKVRTKARLMPGHRLCTWADRVRTLAPAGGAKTGSTGAKLRPGLEQWPACKALLQRFRADASGLLACQQMLTTQGRSHDTRVQCEPLLDTMPSSALRQEFRASLDCELTTATTLGRAHLGVPISSDASASLFGMAKARGVGETPDAARIALRLPAFCGVPTREEAEHVLQVSVARQQERTTQFTSLTTQRREVLGHPERLASLSLDPAHPQVERIPSPKNRSNDQDIISISNGYEECYGPLLRHPGGLHFLENAGPPGRRETALTSWSQKPGNEFGPKMAFLDTLHLRGKKSLVRLPRGHYATVFR